MQNSNPVFRGIVKILENDYPVMAEHHYGAITTPGPNQVRDMFILHEGKQYTLRLLNGWDDL